MGSMGQEEEMLKQVQHDNFVCVDSLVWVRWGKKKRCRNKFGMTI